MRIGLQHVPWWIVGLIPAHILMTQALSAIVAETPIVGDTVDEAQETWRAFIFLVIAVWEYRQTDSTPSVLADKRPHHSLKP